MPGFSFPRRPAKLRNKIYNEKYMVILLLIVSTITIFVILMKLPPDLQRAVNRDVNRVFMPSVANNQVKLHNQEHQHPPPPIFNDFDDGEYKKNNLQIEPHEDIQEFDNKDKNLNDVNQNLSIEQKRDKIKQV